MIYLCIMHVDDNREMRIGFDIIRCPRSLIKVRFCVYDASTVIKRIDSTFNHLAVWERALMQYHNQGSIRLQRRFTVYG